MIQASWLPATNALQRLVTTESKMFLTPEEIIELTSRKRKDAQLKVLRHMGIEHRVRPDGSLAVLKSHIEKEFDGTDASVKRRNETEPNWKAIR